MLGSLLKKITGLGNIEMRIYNQNTRQTLQLDSIVTKQCGFSSKLFSKTANILCYLVY